MSVLHLSRDNERFHNDKNKEVIMSRDDFFNIMLSDLTPDAQKKFLEFNGTPGNPGNFDLFPVAVIYRDVDDGDDDDETAVG